LAKLRVGVLFGGRSAEHEVSIVSARSIIQALDAEKYEIIPIGLSKDGRWFVGRSILQDFAEGQVNGLRIFLPADPTLKRLVPHQQQVDDTGLHQFFQQLDVVFPVLHGTFGEDGTIQGLLELADIPYVGAGVLGSALAMDKIMQKLLFAGIGLPVVDFLWIRSSHWSEPVQVEPSFQPLQRQLSPMSKEKIIKAVREALGFPVFVKPANLGSSVGISKAHNERELGEGIDLAVSFDRKVIIEKAVVPAREIEVSVLGNENPRASVAGEVIPSNEFYDYDAKYVDGKSELKIPAPLPEDLHSAIRSAAIKSVLATEVEGMARVDFLLNANTNEFFISEINTIPGFTQISMYPKLWQATGLSYSALLDELISLALKRHQEREKLRTSYQPKKDWYK